MTRLRIKGYNSGYEEKNLSGTSSFIQFLKFSVDVILQSLCRSILLIKGVKNNFIVIYNN